MTLSSRYNPPIVENLKLLEREAGKKNSTDHVEEWLKSNIIEVPMICNITQGDQYALFLEAFLLFLQKDTMVALFLMISLQNLYHFIRMD